MAVPTAVVTRGGEQVLWERLSSAHGTWESGEPRWVGAQASSSGFHCERLCFYLHFVWQGVCVLVDLKYNSVAKNKWSHELYDFQGPFYD